MPERGRVIDIQQVEDLANTTQRGVPYATFYIGKMLLGIQVRRVREVNRHLEWTKVPHAPPFVLGVMSLRGEVLTVVDLALLLGLKPSHRIDDRRNVIIQVGDELIGLVVDRVADIHGIPFDSIEPAPSNLNDLDAKMTRGVYQTETEIVVILNADEMLSEN